MNPTFSAGGNRRHTFNGTDFINQIQAPIAGLSKSVCIDDVGKGVDHALSITHTDCLGIGLLNGSFTSGLHSYNYQGWFPDLATAAPNPVPPTSLPSAGVVATATLARSNPSRPSVSVPNFIYELKDLPGMLKEIGRLKLVREGLIKASRRPPAGNAAVAAREASNLYLSYRMGWAPFISDIRKMLQFRDQIKNRVHDLDILFNQNGGLHRSVGKGNTLKGIAPTWSEVSTTSSVKTIDSALGILIQVRSDVVTSTQMWGSVRWTNPYPRHSRLSYQELERQARDIVFGLNVTPKEVWDAVPWTWLVDWFANFGDYLDSTNNLLSLAPSVPLVMTHQETKESWTRVDTNTWCSGGSGTLRYETKTRTPSGATLSATLPIFSGGQLATLSSLAIQRIR